MFEDSLFASKVAVRPARSRWAAVAAVVVQGVAAAALLVMPMLRPLALPVMTTAPAVVSVNLRKPVVKVEPVKVRPADASSDLALRAPAAAAAPVMQTRGGGRITAPDLGLDPGPLMAAMGPGMVSGTGPALGVGSGTGELAALVVRAKSSAPMRISSGVSSGMLLEAIRPVYPAIARAAGVSGTVVVSARIDRSGRIVGAVILSGPGMLRNAALEAVEAARYRPYFLNGEATEVETTIVVNFRMNG